MKILIVSPAPPNLYHRMRLHTTIKALMVDHKITLVSLGFDTGSFNEKRYKNTKFHFVHKGKFQCYLDAAGGLLSTNPLEVSYCKSGKMKALCKDLVNKHDLILIKRLRSLQYLPENIKTTVLLDTTDAMSLFYRRGIKNVSILKKPLFIEEYIKYKLYEKKASKIVKNWIVCAKDDINYLDKLLENSVDLFYIQNVVDTDYFKPEKSSEKSDLVFTGLMDKPINYLSIIDFIETILPDILKSYPKLTLKVIGPNPPEKLRQFENKNIEVTGNVKDLRPYINGAKVIIAPIVFGTGSSFKVTQAWSHAKPVVSNSIGARGLKYENGKHIFVTDNKKEFSDNVKLLLKDRTLARKMGYNARENAIKYYSVKTMRRKYSEVINTLLKNDL